jgi:hypothetical protein
VRTCPTDRSRPKRFPEGLDPINSSFRLRGYVRTSWCDPRQGFDPVEEGSDVRVLVGRGVDRAFEQKLWSPGGYPVNAVGEMNITERVLRIYPDGTVEQDINLFVRLENHFDLRRFPFDHQTLQMQIESFLWSSDRVAMVEDPARTGFRSDLDLPEWTIESATGEIIEAQTLRSDRPFSRFVLSIEIARKPGFYLWKVFLPLAIIVALSWSIFWMSSERLASRSRISATGVLTIVAYQFVFAADMPRVGYLTLFDKVMIISFGVLAITVLESMYIDRFQDDDMPRAERIDRRSRWVFPLFYGLLVLAAYVLG